MTASIILLAFALGGPCVIMSVFLWECFAHYRELERAERELNALPDDASPRYVQRVFRGQRNLTSTPEKK